MRRLFCQNSGKTAILSQTSTLMLAPAKLRDLKARSQKLRPVLRVGNEGITPSFLAALDEVLRIHGLVKLKFEGLKEQKKSLVPEMASATDSKVILFVGNTVTLYREPG